MKESNLTFGDFTDKFNTYFNGSYNKNFSYEGKRALFEYLEQYEDETGEEIELDIIALCCEYSEYNNIEEYLKEYTPTEIGIEPEDYETEEDHKERIKEELEKYLNNNTTLIKFSDDLDDGFIIQDF